MCLFVQTKTFLTVSRKAEEDHQTRYSHGDEDGQEVGVLGEGHAVADGVALLPHHRRRRRGLVRRRSGCHLVIRGGHEAASASGTID